MSVRLSVRQSLVGVLLKQLNIAYWHRDHTKQRWEHYFSDVKDLAVNPECRTGLSAIAVPLVEFWRPSHIFEIDEVNRKLIGSHMWATE